MDAMNEKFDDGPVSIISGNPRLEYGSNLCIFPSITVPAALAALVTTLVYMKHGYCSTSVDNGVREETYCSLVQ